MRMGCQQDTELFLLQIQLYPNCRQKKKCMKVKVAIARKNVNSHLACVVRGNHMPIIRSLIQRATHNIPLMVRVQYLCGSLDSVLQID